MVHKKRRRFEREFKRDVARMVLEGGHSIADVSRDMDLRRDMVRRWVREFSKDPAEAFSGHGVQKGQEAELAQLRRELRRVREERDILKKAVAIFSEPRS